MEPGEEQGVRLRGVLDAHRRLVGDLDLPSLLRSVVTTARELTGARYGALGVVAADGQGLEEFVHVGLTDEQVARIGHLPQGRGLLGALVEDPHPIRLDDLADDPRAAGFPEGHPPMRSFLGVPIRSHGAVFGNLYLTDAGAGRFTAEDEVLVTSLAATAGVAVANARLFRESRMRQDWLEASAEVTRRVLGLDGSAALGVVSEAMLRLSGADLVLVLVPEAGVELLTVTAAAGEAAGRLLGRRVPAEGTVSRRVLDTGEPVLVDDPSDRDLGRTGLPEALAPAVGMLLPLVGQRRIGGVLVAARTAGRPAFTPADLELATMFSWHAALALELSETRAERERSTLLEDRDRIARDLHDHVIQQLFAAGMTLQAAAVRATDADQVARLDRVVDSLDDAVRQIRTSIFRLSGPHAADSLRGAVLAVAGEVTPALGFAPRVSFTGPVEAVTDDLLTEDVLAVVREGLTNTARHAGADRVSVRVRADAGALEIVVADDGRGVRGARRSGLANLADRAERRSGTLSVGPGPGGDGTVLTWTVRAP